MTTYYVDPAASGSNNGTSWTDAWTNIQTAFDTATAGDVVYCRGTQTLTVSIDVDTNKGHVTNGYISFIGVNASGTEDGTRFVLDGNYTAEKCLLLNDADFYYFANMSFNNALNSGVGFVTSASSEIIFNNCSCFQNGAYGIAINYYGQKVNLIRCVSHGNGIAGFLLYEYTRALFCRAYDHTASSATGFVITGSGCLLVGCLAYSNSGHGFAITDNVNSVVFYNCVSNSNSSASGANGFYSTSNSYGHIIIGCRITNHNDTSDTGINWTNGEAIECWNYFQNNTTDIASSTYTHSLTADGAATSLANQGDTESGYTDQDDPENFNLTSDATLRRTEITVPES